MTESKTPESESPQGDAPHADTAAPGDAADHADGETRVEPSAAGISDEPSAESSPATNGAARQATEKRPTVVVRYGAMGFLGRFRASDEHLSAGQQVVVKSDRGQEMGTFVAPWDPERSPIGVRPDVKGEVLRAATHADEIEARHLHDGEQREKEFCRQRIAERKLPMKLVSADHLFGGDRVIFYFVAESRIDFRSLVRDLAREFQTRIEMRQIGVRDEARLVGDYERCGMPLCCRAWIKDLSPISMKMAKIQKATLDPTKISGHCGRLMCCLRFEHTTYRDLAANLPRRNTFVRVREGIGKVVDRHIVAQLVGLQLQNGRRVNVPLEDILDRDVDPNAEPPQAPPPPPPRDEGRRGSRRREQAGGAEPKDSSDTKSEEDGAASKKKRRGRRGRRSRGGRRSRSKKTDGQSGGESGSSGGSGPKGTGAAGPG